MNSATERALLDAVKLLGSKPRGLGDVLKGASTSWDLPVGITVTEFFTTMEAVSVTHPLRLNFHANLAEWDYTADAPWIAETPANTRKRRDRMYDLLGLSEHQRKICDTLFPYAPVLDAISLIVEPGPWEYW